MPPYQSGKDRQWRLTLDNREAHRTPNFDWEVVRRQLDSTFTSLTKCWKEFGSGLDTLLRSDDDLGDTLDSTKKINEDDCMELHEAISDIIPPLKEFAARLGSRKSI